MAIVKCAYLNKNVSSPRDSVPRTAQTAYFHLPGLFEFAEFYRVFLPLFREKREYFYNWCDIWSIYGAPADCLWGGGRVGFGDADPKDVIRLMEEHLISPRLTFSNSLLRPEHLADKKCNDLCDLFAETVPWTGIILHSDILLRYLRKKYPDFYFVSSTTKVLTDFPALQRELRRREFSYVVPDFRLNKALEQLSGLRKKEKEKVEFLCNECCDFGCSERKKCYENVSRKSLGEAVQDHVCRAPNASRGYRFSDAMKNPGFIGVEDIKNTYLPLGFSHFKIEGRSLGSALLLEFILYYMTKPEHQLRVREELYLSNTLDLF